jgi:hypothetical protein
LSPALGAFSGAISAKPRRAILKNLIAIASLSSAEAGGYYAGRAPPQSTR